MGGDIETIKERLNIADIVAGYVKLSKAGKSLKGRCPFHNEKTPSFFVSPDRGSYYCFGCGAKGDIFTFVEQMEGLSFREALKSLGNQAGVEVSFSKQDPKEKSEKDLIRQALEHAADFFEKKLEENSAAKKYVKSRGIDDDRRKLWCLGYAPAEWRALYSQMLAIGYKKEILVKAGLAKIIADRAVLKDPYDVFRDRIIFPLLDTNGNVIAFSGRALSPDTQPKYLNSPDTVLFTKSEVLYGLDKAKDKIRRKDYAVLVEGQIDLVLSHQAGVENTVASSGTAFTQSHLEKLKRFSSRIILAFDGDAAGHSAAKAATNLALELGLEVKVARLPSKSDPAEVIKKNPKAWREILKKSLPAIEHFLNLILEEEPDVRKQGMKIDEILLPLLMKLKSSIERGHFVSLISKRTGIKEEMIWEDLRRVSTRPTSVANGSHNITSHRDVFSSQHSAFSKKEKIEERLTEVRMWLAELPKNSPEEGRLLKEETELKDNLAHEELRQELSTLTVALSRAETSKEDKEVKELALSIQKVLKGMREIEERKKVL